MSVEGWAEEKEIIAGLFSDAWTETAIAWPGKAFKTPDADTVSWVEFNILNGEASQQSTGAPGRNVFRHPGIVSLLIFTPARLGEEEALRLADLAAEVYRNETSEPDIRFSAPSINKLGFVKNYHQVNVSIPFNRDSLL